MSNIFGMESVSNCFQFNTLLILYKNKVVCKKFVNFGRIGKFFVLILRKILQTFLSNKLSINSFT